MKKNNFNNTSIEKYELQIHNNIQNTIKIDLENTILILTNKLEKSENEVNNLKLKNIKELENKNIEIKNINNELDKIKTEKNELLIKTNEELIKEKDIIKLKEKENKTLLEQINSDNEKYEKLSINQNKLEKQLILNKEEFQKQISELEKSNLNRENQIINEGTKIIAQKENEIVILKQKYINILNEYNIKEKNIIDENNKIKKEKSNLIQKMKVLE